MRIRFVWIVMWMLLISATQQSVRAFRPISRQSMAPLRLLADTSNDDEIAALDYTPWNRPSREDYRSRRSNKTRFRQHVNPLARQYQLQAPLSDEWPRDVFHDMSLPLHLDIGCGKGGFLLELAAERPGKNYLGLEIRPSVAEFAQERVAKRNLTGTLGFVGCNANVDLDRLLTRWDEAGGGPIQMVTIQFPDPHFKNQHAKRRVVTDQLVQTLAKFMEPASAVFLQSDVQELLDDMRLKFRELDNYFEDLVPELDQYMQDNYIGTPTEREISVLKRDLPVYRTLFHRTMKPFARYKEYYGEE